MHYQLVIFLLLSSTFCSGQIGNDVSDTGKTPVDYINPLIGTAFEGFSAGLEGGGAAPFVNRPFAMTNFLAQTNQNKMGLMAYTYEQDRIIGFLASHQPTVWMGDYGYVSIMPQIGAIEVLPERRGLHFRHEDEVSKPHYYSVIMQSGTERIRGEIAGASRAAEFRFTFPAKTVRRIIIQGINVDSSLNDPINDYQTRLNTLEGYVWVDPVNRRIVGFNPDRQSAQLGPPLENFRGYFVLQFDRDFMGYGTWNSAGIVPGGQSLSGARVGAYVEFGPSAGDDEPVLVKIGTSFISEDQAIYNMNHEIPGWDFEGVVADTYQAWKQCMDRLVLGNSVDDRSKKIFYTALYRTLLFPREFSEYGRYYSAFDDRVHKGDSYNDFSLWDTFRAQHPLIALIQPERVNPMINSLLQMYQEGGWLPKWPNPTYTNIMIGTHADAVISDAYVKGFRGYDIELALAAMMKNAEAPPQGDTLKRWRDRERWTSYEARAGLTYYLGRGFVPADQTEESVSRTIEFGIDDWCIAQVAKGQGQSVMYEQLMKSSSNWKNLYNRTTGFIAPRNSDGSWYRDKDVGFTEGSKWTYLFGAMHDIEGMINIMGGRDSFVSKLDTNFQQHLYRHDNEPGHHYIYLYNYVGQPWKTQELIRKHTSEENFRDAPIGINGNDDCGQMSAWYLFSVMGFYPVVPASGEYVLGAPQFSDITLRLSENRILTVRARNLSEENKYVKAVYLNGERLSNFIVKHAKLMEGGTLEFVMTDVPTNAFPELTE
ncbi:alpha-1 2-mannosidase [Parapedobacter defluvii]|uniref:Alpha-1 2-mannosidase n=1 Tax=Parapedobacter defluvii TaxID=2045106 RepID=A0ABQ1M0E7_9SPHI|nr:GH92 family glycosyl hydrolase [Parapedobacter defluvii]GGC32744.1 alpha-1 2-mannosidase [Parapedobacter defluvii]